MENLSGKEIYSEPGPQNPGMKSTNKPYCIDPNKVKIVKKFLDNNFERATMTRIGPNGMQEKVKVVGLLDKDSGNILRNMYLDDLEDQVITRFQNMFSDKNERQLFMNKIINYWFDDKISPLGMLPINHL
jgi:hypothetical protein